VRWLQSHLHKSGVTVQSAPYTAAAQLAYLESTNTVDAVAGSANCLIFGADKVITHFDFDGNRVSWVESQACTRKLGMNSREQFADLMLLSGCSILPPLPELEQQDNGVARIQTAKSLLQRFNQDGHAVCLQQPKPDDEYLSSFRKAKFAIRHAISLTSSGHVEAREAERVPNNVHDFVGQRLPEEVYFYLSRGVAGPRVLNWRARMQVYETPPLDGGASQVYKDLVQERLRALRAQGLALVTRSLHRYYQKTDVDLVCWFNEGDKRPLGEFELTDLEHWVASGDKQTFQSLQQAAMARDNSTATPHRSHTAENTC